MVRRRSRKAPPVKKPAAKKKKKSAAKRPKAALSKGYWEALERIERGIVDLRKDTHEVRLALEALQREVAAAKAENAPAATNDEAGD